MQDNPYVGPRPYERDDRHNFFGRGREARDLLALMLAERVLLFYAQSGAGKTSLLNAQVIPLLEEKGLNVLPVARVGSDLPPGIDPTAVSNVFVFSALMGLAGADVAPETLLEHTLHSFLETRCCIDQPPLLILDQFEELFTTHRDRWQEARDFFVQLRQVLDGIPKLGVTLAMREDHIAELDPYAPLLPGRLRARFRMERLGPQAAVEAVAKPAANAGCPFDPGVAERLVDDLRRIKTQEAGSRTQEAGGEEQEKGDALGPYVEPVQLQVVCNRLWERLPDHHDGAIQWEKVEQYGNIDRALVDFYESALSQTCQVADATSGENLTGLVVTERRLRRWFSEELITPMETRGLAMRGRDDTAGLPNAAVDVLEAQHLIRADVRAGARWYELCHDRMVEPIVQSNRGWEQEQENLHPWRPVARQWEKAPSETLLYRGKELEAAQAWLAAAGADAVEGYERAFIEASGKAERARRRRRRTFTALGVVGILVLLVMAGLTTWAIHNQREAQKQARRARVGELAGYSEASLAQDASASLALMLAREAVMTTLTSDGDFAVQADAALRRAIDAAPSWRMTLPRHRHTDWINSAVFSPDGRVILTASDDQSVRLWDVSTGKEIRRLNGHIGRVLFAVFSPDGGSIVTTGEDQTVRVWETASGREIGRLVGHADTVWSANFSPDGKRIATASSDQTIRIWDASSRKEIHRLVGHTTEVVWAAFGPDGQTLVSASADRTARVWDIATPTPNPPSSSSDRTARVWDIDTEHETQRLDGHTEEIVSAVFSPDGQRIVTASFDRTARIWNASTGQEIYTITGHFSPVLFAVFSLDGKTVLTAGADGTARIWDANSGQEIEISPLIADSYIVQSAVYSPDGQMILTAGADGTARLWDATTGQEIHGLEGHAVAVKSLVINPDGQILLSIDEGHTMRVWDAVTGDELGWSMGRAAVVNAAAFSPDGQRLATVGVDSSLCLWDAALFIDTSRQATSPSEIYCTAAPTDRINSLAFSSDGRRLLTASKDQKACLWDAASGTQLFCIVDHVGWVNLATFSPNGQEFVTVSEASVCLWDAGSRESLYCLEDHSGWVTSAAFSPDGQKLITASDKSKTACVWDTSSRVMLYCLEGHNDRVNAAAFSPDGQYVATASDDRTVCIWDTASGDRIDCYFGHEDAVTAVVFSPDGETLFTASADRTIRVWATSLIQEPHVLRSEWEEPVVSAVFSPDGLFIATCEEGMVGVWMADTTERVNSLQSRADWVRAAVFSPDSQMLATAGTDGGIQLWEVARGEEVGYLTGHTDWVNAIAFSADGKMILTAGSDRTARLWHTITRQELRCITGHTGRIWSAVFSPDDKAVLTASEDGTACLWETSTGRKIRCFEQHNDWVRQAVFSPDGHSVATASQDRTVRLWDVGTGQELVRLPGHPGGVMSVAFSPDGQTLAVAGQDGSVYVYEVTTGQEIRRLMDHKGSVNSVVFSPDGQSVLTASSDGTARLWMVDIDVLLDLADSLIQRETLLLTPREQRYYGIDALQVWPGKD